MMNFITDFDLGQVVQVSADPVQRQGARARRTPEPYIGAVVSIEVSGFTDNPVVLYRVKQGSVVSHGLPARCLSAIASYPAGSLMVGDKVRVVATVQKGPYPLRPDTVRIVRDVSPAYVIAEAESGFTAGMPQAFDKATCIFTLVRRAPDSFF